MSAEDRRRLDKWLWYARVVKTRSLAQKLIADGAVRVNTIRTTSSAKGIGVGDVLTISLPSRLRVLKLAATGTRRGPAAEAATLFEDLSPPVPKRDAAATAFEQAIRPKGAGRPTKRERRKTDAYLARNTSATGSD